MTFELMRFNWPNIVAILALAAMPIVALAMLPPSPVPASQALAIEDTTNCQLPAGMTVALATFDTFLE